MEGEEVEARVQPFDAIKIRKTTLRTNKEMHLLRVNAENVLQHRGRSVRAMVLERNCCIT